MGVLEWWKSDPAFGERNAKSSGSAAIPSPVRERVRVRAIGSNQASNWRSVLFHHAITPQLHHSIALWDNEPLKNGNQATACRNPMC